MEHVYKSLENFVIYDIVHQKIHPLSESDMHACQVISVAVVVGMD